MTKQYLSVASLTSFCALSVVTPSFGQVRAVVPGVAIVTIGQKQCEGLSSARAEADCLKAPLAPGFAVGVLGAVVAVGGFVGFAANTPSSEEIRQAATGSTPQVEVAVELDPDAQH